MVTYSPFHMHMQHRNDSDMHESTSKPLVRQVALAQRESGTSASVRQRHGAICPSTLSCIRSPPIQLCQQQTMHRQPLLPALPMVDQGGCYIRGHFARGNIRVSSSRSVWKHRYHRKFLSDQGRVMCITRGRIQMLHLHEMPHLRYCVPACSRNYLLSHSKFNTVLAAWQLTCGFRFANTIFFHLPTSKFNP